MTPEAGPPAETGKTLRVARKLVGQEFQRDFSLQSGVARAKHNAHSAFAELCGHFTPLRDRPEKWP